MMGGSSASGESEQATPSKRPRISKGDEPNQGGNDNTNIDPATAGAASATKLPFPSSTQPNSAGATKVKKDPAASTSTAANKMTITMDDSDSDVEILTPSRFPTRPGSSSSNNNNNMNINNSGDDNNEMEVEVTASTTTNPNIDLIHARHSCGVTQFIYDAATQGYLNNNEQYCEKCYCFVCDVPASECKQWTEEGKDKNGGGRGAHCHAHNKDAKWVQLRDATLKSNGVVKAPDDHGEVTILTPPNPYSSNPYNQRSQTTTQHQQITSLVHNEFLSRLESGNDSRSAAEQQRRQKIRERKEMRIHEVLSENFKKAVSLQDGNASGAQQKMEGDIPTLSLHNSFFVSGIKIGWPYPEIMKPQRQMAIHLIKALKDKKHVVLESPTGTGKSAAILCSVLAWQRHHYKQEKMKMDSDSTAMNSEGGGDNESGEVKKVKIIYCSRTHSQVAQMVASLKSTPYRPRMCILGSRERLCIHKSIKPRGQGAEAPTGVNVNNECRLRVRNTEKSRKHHLTSDADWSRSEPYNDDDPPENMPGDGGDGEDVDEDQTYVRRRPTCPHYRQLTTSRVANLVQSTFLPNSKVNCCSVGGKKSKYGAHDIEDLVDFGVDPYLQKDIALYRKEPTDSFGLSLKGGADNSGGCYVQSIKPNTPAEINGSIRIGDKILRVNGTDVSKSNPATVVSKIKNGADPLLLDVFRSGSRESGGVYSSRAACPYYVSHVLHQEADIVFAPYNYVLDPGIRDALGIDLANAVVVLDEGHNIETALREAGSLKVGEFELCEVIVMLTGYAITERSTTNMVDTGDAVSSDSETQYLCDIAHTLLMFVEKVVTKLRSSRTRFQTNPGQKGAAKALRDYEKFHTPDDHEFDVSFDGPTGNGHKGKCVGCLPFFDDLGLTKGDMQT